MIRILYPERCFVSEETIISWAQDSLINAMYSENVDDNLIESFKRKADYSALSLEDAIAILNDEGSVTFAA